MKANIVSIQSMNIYRSIVSSSIISQKVCDSNIGNLIQQDDDARTIVFMTKDDIRDHSLYDKRWHKIHYLYYN
jgi:hypothetical protein